MQAPQAVTHNLQPPVITLFLDDGTEQIAKKFRCPICGHVVFEYYTSLKIMVVGEIGYQYAPTVIQCKGHLNYETPEGMKTGKCRAKYQIMQTKVQY
jgi:hypothetical protein